MIAKVAPTTLHMPQKINCGLSLAIPPTVKTLLIMLGALLIFGTEFA
jgi:hypothetical protein